MPLGEQERDGGRRQFEEQDRQDEPQRETSRPWSAPEAGVLGSGGKLGRSRCHERRLHIRAPARTQQARSGSAMRSLSHSTRSTPVPV